LPKTTFLNLNEKKKKKILKTLIKYFANNSYEKVDIEDVAKECKVSKGSMYQYFLDKKDMYFYAINESIKKMFELVESIDFEKINIFEYLEKSFESNWKLLSKYPNEYLLLERAIFGYDIPFKDEINKLFLNKFRETLMMIIIKSQKSGYIRDDISPDLILNFMEGAIMNIKRYIIEYAKNIGVSSKDLPFDQIKNIQKYFVELLKNGLRKQN
jgi:AcrR family transcriptional regulator